VTELERRRLAGNGPAYIHIVEPRIAGNTESDTVEADQSNQFVVDIWKGPIIRAGGMAGIAEEAAEENDRTLVAIGRYFISNPDLPFRLANDVKLTYYDRDTFYTRSREGYTTYKFAPNFEPKI
jgi:NADPH2 dehydrogenase